MTNIVLPPDTTLLLEALKINGGTGAPASLADGEIYIDEAARKLYTKSAQGIAATPLDVMGTPLTRGVDVDAVLIKTPGASEWRILSAGGGAAEYDTETWRIPGIAPAAVSSLAFPAASGQSALLYVAKPKTLANTRVRALSGTGNLTLSLTDATGAEYFNHVYAVAGAGVYTFAPNVPLPAGLYTLTFTAAAALSIETVQGYLPWASSAQAFPVSMQVV